VETAADFSIEENLAGELLDALVGAMANSPTRFDPSSVAIVLIRNS